jgi:NO-binding membrane sensor protein with MHYT domain
VEWAIAAMPFVGMSAIPVVVNLAVTGWDLSRVSWVAWALSVWLFIMAIGGIWKAIADRDGPTREQDHTRM